MFNSILSLVPEFANGVLNHSSNDFTKLKILGKAKLSIVSEAVGSVESSVF